MPKLENGDNSAWNYFSAWDDEIPSQNWIGAHGDNRVWRGSKSLCIDIGGSKGPSRFGLMMEDGYEDFYLFFMVNIPKNEWPTSCEGGSCQNGSMGTYTKGENYIWWSSWKFGNFDMNCSHPVCSDKGYSEIFYFTPHIRPYNYPPTDGLTIKVHSKLHVEDRYATDAGINLNGYVGDWFGIEYHILQQGTQTLMEIWIYDKFGNATKIMKPYNWQAPDDAVGKKWNRWFFGGNNSNTYKWGPTMQSDYYVDDFILDDQRIGPQYFDIIKDELNLPACTESHWRFLDSVCEGQVLTRRWKKMGNCEGGVLHPEMETIECPNDSDGFLLYYSMDRQTLLETTLEDLSGNENDAIVHEAFIVDESLKGDGALSFDGENDHVDLKNLDISGENLTIIAWINIDDFDVHDARIVSKSTGLSEQDHYWMLSTIRDNGNKLRFRLKTNGATSTLIASDGELEVNKWIHVGAVYDGSEMLLYKDAELVGRIEKTGTIDTNNSVNVWIGNNPSEDRAFDGMIDELRIYKKAFSQEEIRKSYNYDTSGTTIEQDNEPTEYEIIAIGDEWKYFKGLEEPPNIWHEINFDDSQWLSGPTGIGYADNDDATVLEDMQGNYVSIYTRKKFENNFSSITSLQLTIDYDDAFVAYINGTEVVKGNISGRIPAYNVGTNTWHKAGTPDLYDLSDNIHLLNKDTNVLAIRIINGDVNSSGVSFLPTFTIKGIVKNINGNGNTRDTIPPTFKINDDVSENTTINDIINISVFDETSLNTNSFAYGFSPDAVCDDSDSYENTFLNHNDFSINAKSSEYLCIKASDHSDNTAYHNVGQLNVVSAGNTKIFRSVGPGNNIALAIGAENSVSINNSIALFENEIPLHIGVGDAIEYDSNADGSIDAIVFIYKRKNTRSYEVKNASGALAFNVEATNTWSIFRAYTSLLNAEKGNENERIDISVRNFDVWSGGKDITFATGSNEQWNIVCYKDAVDAYMSYAVSISGWTTSENNYLNIYTPSYINEVGTSQRHQGKFDANVGYTISFDANGNSYRNAITILDRHVKIDGLQVILEDDSANNRKAFFYAHNDNRVQANIEISNCLVKSVGAGTSNGFSGDSNYNPLGKYKLCNNIFMNFSSIGLVSYGANSSFYWYNNTVIGGKYGYFANKGTVVVKNSIVQNSTNGFYGTFDPSSDYNISDLDNNAPGEHSINASTVSFVDPDHEDFHLSPNSTAINQGINLSDDNNYFITRDIDGENRSDNWDIGADEYISNVINNDITLSDLNIFNVSASGFDASVKYSGDDNNNAEVKLYYCTKTDDSSCDPENETDVVMTKNSDRFNTSVTGLISPFDQGDQVIVRIIAVDPDGVTNTVSDESFLLIDAPTGEATNFLSISGDSQISLFWSNPLDADFEGVIVLKDTSSIAAKLINGTTYTQGEMANGSEIIYIGNDSQLITENLINEIVYYFKIFTFDSNKNYSSGIETYSTPTPRPKQQYYLSPTGNDKTNDGSSNQPWLTFEHAFSQMSGGDKLILLDGTYSEENQTGYISYEGEYSGQPPSGTTRDNMTVISAHNPGSVIIEGKLFIGRSFRKDSFIKIQGITFIGGCSLYNTAYVYVKDCGFKGHFGVGTNDHNEGNTFNLIEDVWIWSEGTRSTAVNYRAHNNIWRRIVIRGDGGFPIWTKRDPEVGFTVYNSKDVSVQNMIIVDRLLVTDETMRYPYADFATAQHAGENVESPLENNEWLGCLSINSEDNGFYLEADNSLSPTYKINNCAAVGLTDAHFGFNLANGINSIIENSTVIRNNGVGTFFRHSPDASIGQITRNVIGIGPANSAIINGGDTSYVNFFGTFSSEKYNNTTVSGLDLITNPMDDRANDEIKTSLVYPIRIEDGSQLAGAGYGGKDIGANIINRSGVTGSFYGDPDYNAETNEPLWPWPNEDRIKLEMSKDSTRGFCSYAKQLNGIDNTTLTSYIWEYLGNEMPCEIYNKCEPEQIEGTSYFIATDGSDINNGSNVTPWATFAHALTVLKPGDTLIIKDGSYHEQINPTISGTPGNPITIAAENTGGVIIEMLEDGSAVEIYSNKNKTISYITIEGIIARGHGEYNAINVYSADNVNEAQMTNNIVIRKTGAFGSSNLRNREVFGIGNNVRDSLFEDIWAYGFGRKALIAFGCKRVTVRRAVLRHDYWDGSEYKVNDPRSVFSGYNTHDSIFENIIAIDAAPTPEGRSSDRSCIIASGNESPALVSGSENNKYLGIIALNNFGNGFKVNGGTGDPSQNIYFKDILAWNNTGYGMVVENNANKITIINGTFGINRTGLKVEQYADLPITNAIITNSFAFNNTYSGFLYNSDQIAQFELNTSTQNGSNNFDSEHAPTMNYIVQPEMVEENDRGAIIINRYIDGNLTEESLWPWPNEDLIKQHMCNPADLKTVNRVAENGPGWEPGWCTDDKTLTQYIWEYLDNEIPCEIYNSCDDPEPILGDINNDGEINLTDAILALQIISNISVANDILHKHADINEDGIINLDEAIYILQYIK